MHQSKGILPVDDDCQQHDTADACRKPYCPKHPSIPQPQRVSGMKSSGFSHFPGAYRVPQKIDSKDRKPKHRNPLHSKENIFDLFKMLSAAFRHRHRREHQLSAAARHIVVDQGIIIQPAKLCGHAGALRNVQIVNIKIIQRPKPYGQADRQTDHHYSPCQPQKHIFDYLSALRHRRLLSYLILILRTAPIFPLCPAHKKCYTMKKQGGNSTCI